MQPKLTLKLVLLALLLPATLFAQQPPTTLTELQHDWAVAEYQLKGDEQVKAYETLIARADAAVEASPKSADLLIWNGIIKSAFAGVKGGLGAMSYAKQARKSLEEAIDIDGDALSGSAYTSLGTLYFKVPGWPIGFGNDKKAVEFLQKALAINPDGIDPNYFYADYLIEKKQWGEAKKYLEKAQAAAPRPDRPIADWGRQQQVAEALAVVTGKLTPVGT